MLLLRVPLSGRPSVLRLLPTSHLVYRGICAAAALAQRLLIMLLSTLPCISRGARARSFLLGTYPGGELLGRRFMCVFRCSTHRHTLPKWFCKRSICA